MKASSRTCFHQAADSVWGEWTAMRSTTVDGRVSRLKGTSVGIVGIEAHVGIGHRILISSSFDAPFAAEVVSVDDDLTMAMPFDEKFDATLGSRVIASIPPCFGEISVSPTWLGRVIDPMGLPLDCAGPVLRGSTSHFIRASPVPANDRAKLGRRLETGIRAIDLFAT